MASRKIDPNDPALDQVTHEPTQLPRDLRDDDAYQFVHEIEDFLSLQHDSFFGRETLEGIRTTVENSKRVSEAQRLAFKNIRERVEQGGTRIERSRGSWGRRYEGR